MLRVRFSTLILMAVSFLGTTAATQAAFVKSYSYSDRLVYSGTYSRFTTAANAQNNTNATSNGTVAPRDLSTFFARGITNPGIGGPGELSYDSLIAAGGTGNYSQFSNQAFYQVPGGSPNPNRDPNNLVQIDDINGNSVTSHTGFFTNAALTQFRLMVSGQNAFADRNIPMNDPAFGDPDLARLAIGGLPTQASNPSNYGNWLDYNVDITFGGLNGTLNPTFGPGFYSSSGDPTSATGTFTGVFQRYGATPLGDDFFRVNLNVVLGNTYGFANRNNGVIDEFTLQQLGITNGYYISQFGGFQNAPAVVPVPPSVVMGAIGALTLLGLRRRLFMA